MFTTAFASAKNKQKRAGGTSPMHFLTNPCAMPQANSAANVGDSQTNVLLGSMFSSRSRSSDAASQRDQDVGRAAGHHLFAAAGDRAGGRIAGVGGGERVHQQAQRRILAQL